MLSMTLAEARLEARRRWYAHGGWADFEPISKRCAVGILMPGPRGVYHYVLGVADTFEKAFSAAERTIVRRNALRGKTKQARRAKLGWPQEDLWPDKP
jgi:hypothetical protein